MKINRDVLVVLERAELDGRALRLTGPQLDRATYAAVNKAIEAAGGKWNRKARAHLFDTNPADILEQLLLTGEISTPQDMGYFPTPPAVVAQLLILAKLKPGMTVLEPSAGTGAIAGALVAAGCVVDCIEIDEGRAKGCAGSVRGARTVGRADFLDLGRDDLQEDEYDRVVMNPPFAKKADIVHVRHALSFVKPGGRLVSVMSNSVTFRADKAAKDFRALVDERGGNLIPLPDNAFKESGTDVHTVIAVIPSAAEQQSRGLVQPSLFDDAALA